MNHHQAERAERQAEHQHVRDQVRREELLGVREVADRRQHRAGGTREEEVALVLRKLRKRLVCGLPEGHARYLLSVPAAGGAAAVVRLSSSLLRSPAGTSSSGAYRLSCSAFT